MAMLVFIFKAYMETSIKGYGSIGVSGVERLRKKRECLYLLLVLLSSNVNFARIPDSQESSVE